MNIAPQPAQPPQHRSLWKSLAQGALDTAIPFARLVEYGAGKEFVTGAQIDRKKPIEAVRAFTSLAATGMAGFGIGAVVKGARLGTEAAEYGAFGALPLAVQAAVDVQPAPPRTSHVNHDTGPKIMAPGPFPGHDAGSASSNSQYAADSNDEIEGPDVPEGESASIASPDNPPLPG